jgi:hypothetical protein
MKVRCRRGDEVDVGRAASATVAGQAVRIVVLQTGHHRRAHHPALAAHRSRESPQLRFGGHVGPSRLQCPGLVGDLAHICFELVGPLFADAIAAGQAVSPRLDCLATRLLG